MAQKTFIREVHTTHETKKENNGRQNPCGQFKDLKRDGTRQLTLYEGRMKGLKRDKGTSPTLERDNSIKALQENIRHLMETAMLLLIKLTVGIQLL